MTTVDTVISLENVNFSFTRSNFKMENLNINVKTGEFVGLVGESGSGKSTIGRLLACLYSRNEPDSLSYLNGHLRFSGSRKFINDDLFDYSYNQLRPFRKKVQYLFQNHRASVHANMTVKQTMWEAISLQYPSAAKEKKMDVLYEILGQVGLLEGGDISADNNILSNRSRNLSGGQIKRLALARTLVLNPDVLIADEPLTGLDASRKGRVLEYITQVWEKRRNSENPMTVILISHDMGMILRLCNRILVLYGDLISKKACLVEDIGDLKIIENKDSLHPYTRQLLAAMDYFKHGKDDQILLNKEIGNIESGKGCVYGPLCPEAQLECFSDEPILKPVPEHDNHHNACFVVNP